MTKYDRLHVFESGFAEDISGEFRFHETAAEGKGWAKFTFANESTVFKLKNKTMVSYLSIKKIADGGFLNKNENEEFVLNLVELKKSVNQKEISKIFDQFDGAYLTIKSALGLIGLSLSVEVNCYIAYTSDRTIETADPILLKPNSPIYYWKKSQIISKFGFKGKLFKSVRVADLINTDEFNCDFGVV